MTLNLPCIITFLNSLFTDMFATFLSITLKVASTFLSQKTECLYDYICNNIMSRIMNLITTALAITGPSQPAAHWVYM